MKRKRIDDLEYIIPTHLWRFKPGSDKEKDERAKFLDYNYSYNKRYQTIIQKKALIDFLTESEDMQHLQIFNDYAWFQQFELSNQSSTLQIKTIPNTDECMPQELPKYNTIIVNKNHAVFWYYDKQEIWNPNDCVQDLRRNAYAADGMQHLKGAQVIGKGQDLESVLISRPLATREESLNSGGTSKEIKGQCYAISCMIAYYLYRKELPANSHWKNPTNSTEVKDERAFKKMIGWGHYYNV